MAALTRSAFVTNPVAVNAVVTVRLSIVAPLARLIVQERESVQTVLLIVIDAPTPVGVPVIAGFVIVGALPKEVREEAVTPAARVAPVRVPAAAGAVQVEPSVQVWPLTVVAELAKSALETRPVAVNDPVTVSPAIVGPTL